MTAIRSSWVLAGFVLFACLTASSSAQSPAAATSDPYRTGVLAYFSGDDAAAEQWLAEAAARDPKDPRPVYFHGLSLLRQGRRDEACSNFMVAASLESRSRNSYPVGKSLERVQGADRLLLEKFRWQARSAEPAIVGNPATSAVTPGRYSFSPAEQRALRQPATPPLDRSVQPASLSELVDASPATTIATDNPTNPFADDPASASPGKLSSGKLIGIVGRALMQSAPVPSLDALRDHIPIDLPIPADDVAPAQADFDFGSESSAPSADEDPFAEPATNDREPNNTQPAAEEIEEDPFG
jgi:hypothetical protein